MFDEGVSRDSTSRIVYFFTCTECPKAVHHLAERVIGYGMDEWTVDVNDALVANGGATRALLH